MRPQASAIMLSFLLGFAQIRAEIVPDGIMPRDKRQVAGTGVTTTSDTPVTPTPTTSDTPTTGDTTAVVDPTTSNTPATTTDAGTTDAGTTTQAGTTAATTDASAGSSPSAEESTTIPTSIPVTTTNADGSTVTSQVSTNTVAPASSNDGGNSNVASTDSSDTNIVRVGSSTINRSTLDHKTVITSALIGKSTSRNVYTSTWTSDGQVYSSVVTENAVVDATTGFATATINPSLANGGGDGSNLSDNAKQIIGGVVGGIGGAILVGGLAFVAWRLWGKKKAAAREEPDEVWGGSRPDSIETAKRSSGMPSYGGDISRGDGYSNPNGAINTSSNF